MGQTLEYLLIGWPPGTSRSRRCAKPKQREDLCFSGPRTPAGRFFARTVRTNEGKSEASGTLVEEAPKRNLVMAPSHRRARMKKSVDVVVGVSIVEHPISTFRVLVGMEGVFRPMVSQYCFIGAAEWPQMFVAGMIVVTTILSQHPESLDHHIMAIRL